MKIFVEEGDMIKINRKKFIVTMLVLLLAGTFVLLTTGILIGQEAAQSRSGTYEELKAFTQAMELVQRNYVENPECEGTDRWGDPRDDRGP